jgi:hypothetical protein
MNLVEMIRFTCLCQNRIEVDADMAGGLTQCARCGRLNDVPTLSDLPHLTDDGTYRVDVERPRDDPLRLAELSIVYSKGSTDADGDPIDLRFSTAELSEPEPAETVNPDGGDDVIPLKDEPTKRKATAKSALRPAPRYDPESGELIEQFDLKPDADKPLDPSQIPMAKATIGYASGGAARRVTPQRVAVELLMPVNVAVMGFVFIAHVLLQFSGMVTVTGLWIFGVIPLLLAFLIVSHYGNVIDEIAVQDRDELPRPLRQCALGEDLWQPFVNITSGVLICFAAAILVPMRLRAAGTPMATCLAVAGALVAVGLVLLPGVLLTTNTSGTIVNLRPDRFVGMVKACGGSYVVASGLGMLAFATYGFGFLAADVAFVRFLSGAASPLPMWVHVVGYPMLVMGIYFSHLFCWHLGLMYREHHAQFPWAYQRHVPDPAKLAQRGLRGPAGVAPKPPSQRKNTKEKLRELRELDRKRRAEQTVTHREVNKAPSWTKLLG